MKKFFLRIILIQFSLFTQYSMASEPCSYGSSFGFLLSEKAKESIDSWSTGRLFSIRANVKNENGSIDATSTLYSLTKKDMKIQEDSLLSDAKNIAIRKSHKCYGIANLKHEIQELSYGILLITTADLYTIK